MLDKETILSDWRNKPQVRDLCLNVYSYLQNKENELDVYTFSRIQNETNAESAELLSQVLNYLSSPKWQVLKQIFFFIDELDNDYQFGSEDVDHYIKTGYFFSPVSGKLLDSNEIYTAYELGSCFKDNTSHE